MVGVWATFGGGVTGIRWYMIGPPRSYVGRKTSKNTGSTRRRKRQLAYVRWLVRRNGYCADFECTVGPYTTSRRFWGALRSTLIASSAKHRYDELRSLMSCRSNEHHCQSSASSPLPSNYHHGSTRACVTRVNFSIDEILRPDFRLSRTSNCRRL